MSEMVSASTEFIKSGFGENEAANLARVAALFQNVADTEISAADASSFIISQLKAFNMEAQDAEGIIDRVNEVANQFAVGSNDLSTALELSASGMATYGNSINSTIGLVTAGTEIMTGRSAQVARGLNTIAANLTTNQELLAKYGVEVEKGNGELYSTYEILKQLKPEWDSMSEAERVALGNAIAGKNQYRVFASVMGNYQTAIDAVEVSLNASGSAARENAAYMESLQSQINGVRTELENLARGLIEKGTISDVLQSLVSLLKVLNTDMGQTVVKMALLTGTIGSGIGIISEFGGNLFDSIGAMGKASSTAGKLTNAFNVMKASAIPAAIAIAAIGLAVGGLIKWYKDTHKPLETYTEELKSANNQLQSNHDRLKEISEIPWSDRTPEILSEKDALEKENEELQKQIDKLTELEQKAAQRILTEGGADETTVYQATGGPVTEGLGLSVDSQTFASMDELIDYLNKVTGHANLTKEEFEALGYTFKEFEGQIELTGQAYEDALISKAQELEATLLEHGRLTDEQILDYQEVTEKLHDVANAHEVASDGSKDAQNALNSLSLEYERAVEENEKLSDAVRLTKNGMAMTDEEVNKLKKDFPELANSIVPVRGEYYLLTDASVTLANGLISENGRIKQSSAETAKKILTDLRTILVAYRQMYGIFETVDAPGGDSLWEQNARDKIFQYQSMVDKLDKAIKDSELYGYESEEITGTGGSSGSGTKREEEFVDEYLKTFEGLYADLEHQRDTGEKSEEEYYNDLTNLVKWYVENAEIYIGDGYKTREEMLRNMYEYEKEIYDGLARLEEERAKAAKEALEAQAKEMEEYARKMTERAQREINAINDEIDAVNKRYDDEIAELERVNEEIDRRIEKERLLEALARAQSQQQLVFQDGQFQYTSDSDAVSEAQTALQDYERQEELRKQKEYLESRRDAEVAALEEERKRWEEYKEGWETFNTDYELSNEIFNELQLGAMELEQENWNTRLASAQEFVSQYLAIMDQLNGGGGSGGIDLGGTGGGGGPSYSFGGGGGSSSKRDAAEEVLGDYTTNSKDTGYYNPDFDYSAYMQTDDFKNLPAERKEDIEAQRQNKIDSKYEGKEPNMYNKDYTYSSTKKHAEGTLNAPGGLSLVGERGPELRVLKSGDGIIPADITKNLWNWGKLNPAGFLSKVTENSNIFQISNLSLPNVKDANSLVSGLKELAYQKTYQRA